MGINFDSRVVLVTGAGAGLGRQHALQFAKHGAKVVVNDLGGCVADNGQEKNTADTVVEEINALGGEAVASYDSVEQGERIVESALDNFGRIDVVVNNAGILRDKSFAKMTDDDWDLVYRVHTLGAFKVTRAAWPHMQSQAYGRIISTSSCALYGNFGQTNYATAKAGLIGFTRTLAEEGRKYGVQANAIAPVAASRMLETIVPLQLCALMKPEFVSALVLKLCAENNQESGALFEVGAGWISKVRFQRSRGVVLDQTLANSPDAIAQVWDQITSFEESDYPLLPLDSLRQVMEVSGYDTADIDFSRGINLNTVEVPNE